MPNSAPPRVFAIGLPHSGGAVLAALFEANGYKWDHHKSGKLAQDLAYAQATGTMPFMGRTLRGVYNIRDHAEGLSKNSREWDDVADDLMCVPRYNIVKTYRDHPDFEVGFVLRARWKKLAASPAFDGLCHPKQSRTWFQKFRYILSLSGNDTGSNFLSAASSNALILMEEDGWELFYTDAFKPSVHYVPLENGAQDVVEKLTWARANPDKCKAMSDAATALYDQFASPENRAAILTQIAAQRNAD